MFKKKDLNNERSFFCHFFQLYYNSGIVKSKYVLFFPLVIFKKFYETIYM